MDRDTWVKGNNLFARRLPSRSAAICCISAHARSGSTATDMQRCVTCLEEKSIDRDDDRG